MSKRAQSAMGAWRSVSAAGALISTLPLATALWSGILEKWPARRDWFAIALGTVGTLVMVTGHDLRASPQDTLLILFGTFSWSFGTVLSRRIEVSPGAMGFELRAEDPANPSFPDLSTGGLIATADPGSLGPCSTNPVAPRVVTFGGGSGVSWPSGNHYLCAVEPPRGAGGLDFCGVLLDTSSTPLGASKVWSSGVFTVLPWNHFLEENVANASNANFRVRYIDPSGVISTTWPSPTSSASRVWAMNAATSDATKFSPLPRPTTSGELRRAATTRSGDPA